MYLNSEQHKENYRRAAALGSIAQRALRNKRKQTYYENPKKCLTCSSSIPYEKKRENKFCQKSCSASFNNKKRGPHSQDTKNKISLSNKKSIAKLILNKVRRKAEMVEKTCPFCQEVFNVRKAKKKQIFCSTDCVLSFNKTDEEALNKARTRGRVNVQKQMLEGKWKGWSGVGEDVRSFPESYIETKLLKDGLGYIFQHQVSRYKIDFAFLKEKVALEVDGKQHIRPEQAESDKRKDQTLQDEGWRVFRLNWKSIKTDSGNKIVEQQYQAFKDFLLATN